MRRRRGAVAVAALLAGAVLGAPLAVASAHASTSGAATDGAGVQVTVAPRGLGVFGADADLTFDVAVLNGTAATLPATTVELVLDADAVTDAAALAAALADPQAAEEPVTATVALGELLPGRGQRVEVVLPASELAGRVVTPAPRVVTAEVDGAIGATAVSFLPETPATVGTTALVALSAPATELGLVDAETLSRLTAQTGALTRRLESVQGTGAAIGLDPMLVASIRALGDSAPASATAWLARVEALSDIVFPLGYGDTDIGLELASGLPRTTIAPADFSRELDADLFPDATATPEPTSEGDGVADPSTAPEPSVSTPPDGAGTDLPSGDELTRFPWNLQGLLWAFSGEVSPAFPAFAAASEASWSVVSDADIDPAERRAVRSPLSRADDATVLLSDSFVSDAIVNARRATDEDAFADAMSRATAGLAISALQGETGVVVDTGRDREGATADRLGDALSALDALPWLTDRSLTDALAGEPRGRVTLADREEDAEAVASVGAVLARTGPISALARLFDDPAPLEGEQRLRSLAVLQRAWTGDVEGRAAVSATIVEDADAVLAGVRLADSSNLILTTTETDLPITVVNDFDRPVTVVVRATAATARLDVARLTTVTVDGRSSQRVLIDATAVSNGSVALSMSIVNDEGVDIGGPIRFQVDVHAEWETIGAVIVGGAIALLAGVGVYRTVVRARRRGRPGRSA